MAFRGLVYGRARAGPTVTVALGGMSLAGDKSPRYIFLYEWSFRDFSIAVLPCGYGSWTPVSTGMTRLGRPAG